MEEKEFDKLAEEYITILNKDISLSGETADFFSEYKVIDLKNLIDSNQPGFSVLDFGCGIGNSIPYFIRHFPNIKLYCADVSKKSLDIAEQKFSNKASYLLFDGLSLPLPDNYLDLVFSACVFHHINHDEHASILRELYRVIKPNGLIVIFEHNPYNPLTVRIVKSCPLDTNAVLIKSSELVSSLYAIGFSSIKTCYRIFLPRSLGMLRFLERYLRWLPLGGQYYVAAVKPKK